MEDPLRPKAVPLAAETVLLFEFLLDPQLITKHLSKPNAVPSALELLIQFISLAPDVPAAHGDDPTEGLHLTRKVLALKILALKVATHLKWNLDIFENQLPFSRQLLLLRDLLTIAFGKQVTVPLLPDFQPCITKDGNEHAAHFAMTFYHRWVLRLQILKEIAIRSARFNVNNVLANEPMHQFYAPDITTKPSIEFLQDLCTSDRPFYVFTSDSFVPLDPNDEIKTDNFNGMLKISHAELRAQVCFDLVNYYLYTEQFLLAREAVIECRSYLAEAKLLYLQSQTPEFHYCHFNASELEGYLVSFGISAQQVTLSERCIMSQLQKYKDIIEILDQDNTWREIPLVNRRTLEHDIEGSIWQGTLVDANMLEMQVAASNVVRGIFEPNNTFVSTNFFTKYEHLNGFLQLLHCCNKLMPLVNSSDAHKIKQFLINSMLQNKKQYQPHLHDTQLLKLFHKTELEELVRQMMEEEYEVPAMAASDDWICESDLPSLHTGALERQLIATTNTNTVRKFLVSLAKLGYTMPLWQINPSWEIPTPVTTVVMSMPRGFLQDFAHVLLGKARELAIKKDYVAAVTMLSVLKSELQRQETNPLNAKLCKLVNWEILLVQIWQVLDEWNQRSPDMQTLSSRCKQCLASLQNGDNIIPRIEIIECCAIMLLNLGEWSHLIFLEKRLPQLELPIAIANTFLDVEKSKGSKKICRDAWDLVLSMFLKRSNVITTSGNNSLRSSPSLVVTSGLLPFLKRVRHQLIFSMAISLLGKIHNILKDDPNHDLNGEHMQLWPTTISNPLGYSVRTVSETLNWVLKEALNYYPLTVSWLKMKGDLELATGNNEAAMRFYVRAFSTSTEYCGLPLTRIVADDYVIRKMIRCSSNLGCHMQAVVLCQFLEEIDYGIVFKSLSEKTSNFNDAIDANYECIWDTTLLEFIINAHAKKGEHIRKLESIAIMGTMELNANNNDEIKREAASIRKQRFLRTLVKQYSI